MPSSRNRSGDRASAPFAPTHRAARPGARPKTLAMCFPRADELGQLLMVGLAEQDWGAAWERFLRQVRPGGVLVSPRRVRGPESTAEFLRQLWLALPVPPLLALEEEGNVDPLRAFFPPLPARQAVARKGPGAVARLGELAGAALRQLGFNTDLAPLLELPAAKQPPSSRLFAAHPDEVARYGEAFVCGLERHKVVPCAKYFPGAGGAEQRNWAELRVVGKTMAELWREDLVPYRALLPRLPLVLVGHSAYKSFDYDLPCPASLSENVVEGLLRTKLGYERVAVADNLNAAPLRRMSEPGELAVRALKAGCDLLIVGEPERSAGEILAGVRSALEDGRLPVQRVEQALARLRAVRKGLAAPSGRVRVSSRAQVALGRQIESFARECRPAEQRIA